MSEASQRQRRRKLMRWIKRGLVLVVAAALAGAAVLALLPKPVPVDLATVAEGPMVVTVNEDGKTRVEHRYTVTAPLIGLIPRLEFEEGDDVEKGAVLVRVVPSTPPLLDSRTRAEAQARLGAALASLRRAKSATNRAKLASQHAKTIAERERGLAAKGVRAKSRFEQAEFEEQARMEDLAAAEFGVKVANQEVASARAALGLLSDRSANKQENLEILAPVSGRVLRVFRRDEGVVQVGTKLMELGDPATLEVVVDVLTRDAVKIREGAPTTIVRWGGKPLSAVVHRVEPSGFTRISALGVEEQRVNVVIHIREPHEAWQSLGDGFRIEAEIETWHGDKVIAVPASAVFRHGDSWAVFVARAGRAKLQPIEVGHRNDASVEVQSGLAAGDRVILHPGDRVVDGVDIEPRANH